MKHSILRRQSIDGYDLSFLFTTEHLKKSSRSELIGKFVEVGVEYLNIVFLGCL